MKTTSVVGRLYKPFDWFGWAMCIIGVGLLCKFGGVGWIFGTEKNWWLFATVFLVFWDYVCRVSFGRVYKVVFYDTIVNNMYKIQFNNDTHYVCAASEEELDLYMESVHGSTDYVVLDKTIVESFIKTENHI